MTDQHIDNTQERPMTEAVPAQSENIITALLKAPHQISDSITRKKDLWKQATILLIAAIVCHAVFGVAMGLFTGVPVAAMDVIKVPLIAVCSLFLCFPSLYVFSCVSGCPLSISQVFMLGCSSLAMVGLLLVGLAPVTWLFAVSTSNEGFVVMLSLMIWFIALIFSIRYLEKLKTTELLKHQLGIKVWLVILVLVTLQMTTCMRPILTTPEQGWFPKEKMFFLSHFAGCFEIDRVESQLKETVEKSR